jgi:hypothetical protein
MQIFADRHRAIAPLEAHLDRAVKEIVYRWWVVPLHPSVVIVGLNARPMSLR